MAQKTNDPRTNSRGAALMDFNQAMPDQTGFIEIGSENHMRLLGLRKADSTDDIVFEGYALEDVTQFGQVVSERYLRQTLISRVSLLKTPFPKIQSSDRSRAGYAVPMVVPPEAREVIPGLGD